MTACSPSGYFWLTQLFCTDGHTYAWHRRHLGGTQTATYHCHKRGPEPRRVHFHGDADNQRRYPHTKTREIIAVVAELLGVCPELLKPGYQRIEKTNNKLVSSATSNKNANQTKTALFADKSGQNSPSHYPSLSKQHVPIDENLRREGCVMSKRTSQLDLFGPSLDIVPKLKACMVQCLAESSLSREQIVDRMNRLLSEAGINITITKSSLDKWVSLSSTAHLIPLRLLPVFCRAVGSIEPMSVLAAPLGAVLAGPRGTAAHGAGPSPTISQTGPTRQTAGPSWNWRICCK